MIKKTQDQYAQEIENTRLGGFGGSDAKLFYNLATKNNLTNTEKKRVAVAKGLLPFVSIEQNEAMKRGHLFEEWFETSPIAPIAEREVLLNKELSNKFKTFAHADFAADGEVWELKCLKNPDEAINSYYSQLQWYYLLGAESVWLVVCDSKKTFEEGTQVPQLIEKDENFIEILKKGIEKLSDMWDDFDYKESEAVGVDEIETEKLKVDILQYVDLKSQIKALEIEAEKLKEDLLNILEVEEIKNIDGGEFKLSYSGQTERRSFDSKKLFKNHPEFNSEEYYKITQIKPSLILKFN